MPDVRPEEADAGQPGDPEGASGQQRAPSAAAAPPHRANQHRLPERGQRSGNSPSYCLLTRKQY